MKTILLLATSILLTLSSITAQSDVTVYSNDGVSFILEVNGVQQNATPATNVKVSDISLEFVSLRLLIDGKSPVKKSLSLDKNTHVSLQLVMNNKGLYKLRFMGENAKEQAVATPNQTVVVYSQTPAVTQSVTTTTTTISESSTTPNESVNVSVNVDGESVSVSASSNGNVSSNNTVTTTETVSTTLSTNSTVTESSIPETIETSAGCNEVSESDLNSFLNSMQAKSFEDSKLQVAKQLAKNNCLRADQIKSIMNGFGFEDTRLEFAKFAYPHCLDQNNYYKVNDAFEFELSIDELNEAIGK